MSLLEILGGMAMSTAAESLKLVTKAGLQKIKDDEGEDEYKATVLGSYPGVKLLLTKVAAKTKTKIDDKGVVALVSAIEESAEENGLTLPDLSKPLSS